jgi:hypothetical protein
MQKDTSPDLQKIMKEIQLTDPNSNESEDEEDQDDSVIILNCNF